MPVLQFFSKRKIERSHSITLIMILKLWEFHQIKEMLNEILCLNTHVKKGNFSYAVVLAFCFFCNKAIRSIKNYVADYYYTVLTTALIVNNTAVIPVILIIIRMQIMQTVFYY